VLTNTNREFKCVAMVPMRSHSGRTKGRTWTLPRLQISVAVAVHERYLQVRTPYAPGPGKNALPMRNIENSPQHCLRLIVLPARSLNRFQMANIIEKIFSSCSKTLSWTSPRPARSPSAIRNPHRWFGCPVALESVPMHCFSCLR
jgi:hypothetical protein